jgi:hypothetical protein
MRLQITSVASFPSSKLPSLPLSIIQNWLQLFIGEEYISIRHAGACLILILGLLLMEGEWRLRSSVRIEEGRKEERGEITRSIWNLVFEVQGRAE